MSFNNRSNFQSLPSQQIQDLQQNNQISIQCEDNQSNIDTKNGLYQKKMRNGMNPQKLKNTLFKDKGNLTTLRNNSKSKINSKSKNEIYFQKNNINNSKNKSIIRNKSKTHKNQQNLKKLKQDQQQTDMQFRIIISGVFIGVIVISFYIALIFTRNDLKSSSQIRRQNAIEYDITRSHNIKSNGKDINENRENSKDINYNQRNSQQYPEIPNIVVNQQIWHPSPVAPISSEFYFNGNIPPQPQQQNKGTNPTQPIPKVPLVRQVNRVTKIAPQQKEAAMAFRNLKNLGQHDPLAQTQYNYYQSKYKIDEYQQEIPICVVVPSYNNAKDNRVENNFNSIRQQNYTNYRVIYINDASNDQTGVIAQQYLNKYPEFAKKVTLKNNQIQQYALPNILYAARSFCKPQQVFIIVDGDDQIIGRQVFKLYNSQFQETGAYFIYSNFLNSRGSIGYSRPFRQDIMINNNYRKAPLLSSHLRAFYTQLLLLIDDQDLRDANGIYFHAANDVAICIPVLQMSHQRVLYLPQITYLYNSATGLNNHMTKLREQKLNDRFIRNTKKVYSQATLDFQVLKRSGHDSAKVSEKKLNGLNQGINQNQIPKSIKEESKKQDQMIKAMKQIQQEKQKDQNQIINPIDANINAEDERIRMKMEK